MRKWPFLLAACVTCTGAEVPAWYRALPSLPGLECTFRQEGESAIFKAVVQEGRLQLSKGGRMRVAYRKGLVLTCDGRELVQFDPSTRTAQRLDLQSAMREAPLLAILVNPSRLPESYIPRVQGNQVVLDPKRPGIPTVTLAGRDGMLSSVSWTDRTGAKQVLTLVDPVLRSAFPPDTFKAQLPQGTRWVR